MANKSLTVGRLTLEIKTTVNGKQYILVTQPVKGKASRRCCWFPEDWMSIKAAIPQVETVLTSGKKDPVKVEVTKTRTINFIPGDKSLLIQMETVKKESDVVAKFSTWMTLGDWKSLVAKQEDIDATLSENSRDLAPSAKRKRGSEVICARQVPVENREKVYLEYYSWTLTKMMPDLHAQTVDEGKCFLFRQECEAAAEKAKAKHIGQSDIEVETSAHRYMLSNDIKLMRMLYIWMIGKEIRKAKAETGCRACDEGQAGQEAHMDSGCLMSWSDMIDTYAVQVEDLVTVDSMVDVYSKVLEFVGEDIYSNVYAIGQCVKQFVTNVTNDLEFYSVMGEFRPTVLNVLFEHCSQDFDVCG